MIPTTWLKRGVTVLAAGIVVSLLASCATPEATADSPVTIVPAAAQAVRTALDVGGLHRVVTIKDVTDAAGLVPALILLHGATGSSARMENVSGMTAIAKKAGFVVAYGDGTGIGRPVGGEGWNAGSCCGAPVEKNIDDIGYLNAVIDTLVDEHHVDPSRVYLGGFSNGAMMSYRAACEIGDRLAGIVVVGGALNVTSCAAAKPLPVLVVHGVKDLTVPYDGGVPNPVSAAKIGSWDNTSVADSVAYWATRDGCTEHTIVATTAVLTDDVYAGCAAGSKLEVISITEGTHRWPTEKNERFDTSAFIVKYFGLAS